MNFENGNNTLVILFFLNVIGFTYFFYLLKKRAIKNNNKVATAKIQTEKANNIKKLETLAADRIRIKNKTSFFNKLKNNLSTLFSLKNKTQEFSFNQVNNTNLKFKLLENEKMIAQLFNEIESHIRIQSEITNQNLELKMQVDTLKGEIKGLSHMWENGAKENQFLREKNQKLLEYSTGLAHSLRRALNLQNGPHTLSEVVTDLAGKNNQRQEKEILSDFIINSINNNETPQKLVDYELNEAFHQ